MENKEKYAEGAGELHDTFKGPQIIFSLHGRGILSGENTPARHGSGSMSATDRSCPHRSGFGCVSADCIPRGCCAGNPETGSAAAALDQVVAQKIQKTCQPQLAVYDGMATLLRIVDPHIEGLRQDIDKRRQIGREPSMRRTAPEICSAAISSIRSVGVNSFDR